MVFVIFLLNRHICKIHQKSCENRSKIFPQSMKNRSKRLKNRVKKQKEPQDEPETPKKRPRRAQERKKCQIWPHLARPGWASAQYADPGLYSVRSFPHDQNKTKPSIGAQSNSNTRSHVQTRVRGTEPPRIVTLREAKRGSAGVPAAKCEAAGDTQCSRNDHVTQKLEF